MQVHKTTIYISQEHIHTRIHNENIVLFLEERRNWAWKIKTKEEKEIGFPRTSNYNKLEVEGYYYLNTSPEF